MLGAVAPQAHVRRACNSTFKPRRQTFAVVILFRLGDQTERKIMYMRQYIAIDYFNRPTVGMTCLYARVVNHGASSQTITRSP